MAQYPFKSLAYGCQTHDWATLTSLAAQLRSAAYWQGDNCLLRASQGEAIASHSPKTASLCQGRVGQEG